MVVELYFNYRSAFSGAVFLTVEALDLTYEEIDINSSAGDTNRTGFVAANSQFPPFMMMDLFCRINWCLRIHHFLAC